VLQLIFVFSSRPRGSAANCIFIPINSKPLNFPTAPIYCTNGIISTTIGVGHDIYVVGLSKSDA